MERLIKIISTLRAPGGCAWDKKQNKASIAQYLLDEVHELLDALAADNILGEREELGDVLFLLLFLAHLAHERGDYHLDEVITEVKAKMERRHPHIFGGIKVANVEEIKANWRAIKAKEKGSSSLLGSIPRSLPQLRRAQKAQTKAAEIGFDWDNISGVFAKLEEEIAELHASLDGGSRKEIAEEVGDVLFTVVNISRFLGIDAEDSLRTSTEKFLTRFQKMEAVINESGMPITGVDAEMLDRLWEKIKESEN